MLQLSATSWLGQQQMAHGCLVRWSNLSDNLQFSSILLSKRNDSSTAQGVVRMLSENTSYVVEAFSTRRGTVLHEFSIPLQEVLTTVSDEGQVGQRKLIAAFMPMIVKSQSMLSFITCMLRMDNIPKTPRRKTKRTMLTQSLKQGIPMTFKKYISWATIMVRFYFLTGHALVAKYQFLFWQCHRMVFRLEPFLKQAIKNLN